MAQNLLWPRWPVVSHATDSLSTRGAVATRPHCPKDPSHDQVQVYNNGPGDLKIVASAVQQLATANVIPQ